MPTPHVYLAGPHALRQPTEWVAELLRAAGIVVTSTWHMPPHEERPDSQVAAARAWTRAEREMDRATEFVLLAAPGCDEALCELGRWVAMRTQPPIVIARSLADLTPTAWKARVHVPVNTTPQLVAEGIRRMVQDPRVRLAVDNFGGENRNKSMDMFCAEPDASPPPSASPVQLAVEPAPTA